MRFLELSPRVKSKADRVVAHARKREHWYVPGTNQIIPGGDRRHTLMLDSYRCVFSYTVSERPERVVYRHLSISVPSQSWPHPVAVKQIGRLFGFTGVAEEDLTADIPPSWLVHINKDHPTDGNCIVVVEKTDLTP